MPDADDRRTSSAGASGARELPRDVATSPPSRPGSPTELDQKLAAALERMGHALRVLIWDEAKRHGLSPMQVHLLLRLAVEPPARRRVSALASELDVRPPTVSDAVATLRRKDLVGGEDAPEDRRGRRLELTDAGMRVAKELTGWPDGVHALLVDVDPGTKAATLALLLDLIGGLQRRGVISVARTCTTCRHFARDAHPAELLRHRCRLLDEPLGEAELRVDCAEHERLTAA